MKIDWVSLMIVATTTVAVSVVVVGLVGVGVAALTAAERRSAVGGDRWLTVAGWALLSVAASILLFGLYLLLPLSHLSR